MKHAAFTRNAPDKPRNGNAFSVITHASGTLVAVLATGDANKPCDWKAAEIAVTGFENAIEAAGSIDEKSLTDACQEGEKAVSEIYGLCLGAGVALTAVAIHQDGDVLVMQGNTGVVLCTLANEVMVLNDTGVVEKLSLEKETGIAILSWGVVNCSHRNYLQDFRYLFSKPKADQNLPLLMERYLTGQTDDLTAIVVVNEVN